ncbi:MAG TPA: peptidoglycan DD-metalloendopeptidase family protein [Geminicoccaceae bacterium]|nr:peptidoglycan DD-metalloendopeptidase family protein [Geminicoccaceae bacterium]
MVGSRSYYATLGRIVALLMLIAFSAGVGVGALAVHLLAPAAPKSGAEQARRGSSAWPGKAGPALAALPLPRLRPLPQPPLLPAALEEEPASAEPGMPAAEPTGAPEVVAPPELEPAERQAAEVVVRRGDTLMQILSRAGIASAEARGAVAKLGEIYDPRKLQPGQTLALELENGPAQEPVRLAALSLDLDPGNRVRLERDAAGGFAATTVEHGLRRERAGVVGTISSNLYTDATRAGLPRDTLLQLVRLFSWDIDFQRDIQPGHGFATLFERTVTEDGRALAHGDLLFASLELGGRTLRAYRFDHNDGATRWYDAEGRSLRKSLLRTPVDGARLSSRFGARRHPVLGYTRMHKGIDFAAPVGTPVFAAGDGTLEFVGTNKGYGNYVRIRHNDEYSTAYAHLSRFAKGMKRGRRVQQGEVIGYVGSTGLSTGPHLHYEILQAGVQVNPLMVRQTAADNLEGEELLLFRRLVAELDALRDQLDHGRMVAQRGE